MILTNTLNDQNRTERLCFTLIQRNTLKICHFVHVYVSEDRKRYKCQIIVSVFHSISFDSYGAFSIEERFEGDYFHFRRKHVELWTQKELLQQRIVHQQQM